MAFNQILDAETDVGLDEGFEGGLGSVPRVEASKDELRNRRAQRSRRPTVRSTRWRRGTCALPSTSECEFRRRCSLRDWPAEPWPEYSTATEFSEQARPHTRQPPSFRVQPPICPEARPIDRSQRQPGTAGARRAEVLRFVRSDTLCRRQVAGRGREGMHAARVAVRSKATATVHRFVCL